MNHPNSKPGDAICPNCNQSAHVRNPSGYCDHLYWPTMLTDEAVETIGPAEIARIGAILVGEFREALATSRGQT